MLRILILVAVVFATVIMLNYWQPAEGQQGGTINWKEAKVVELDKKSRKKSTIFQDFDVLSGKDKDLPIMIYFYFPKPEEEEEGDDKDNGEDKDKDKDKDEDKDKDKDKKKEKKKKLTSKEKKQIYLCDQMEKKLFVDNTFTESTKQFLCVKMDITQLPKELASKYKAKYAPLIVIFDCTGKPVYKINDPNTDIIKLLMALTEIVTQSEEKKNKE